MGDKVRATVRRMAHLCGKREAICSLVSIDNLQPAWLVHPVRLCIVTDRPGRLPALDHGMVICVDRDQSLTPCRCQ